MPPDDAQLMQRTAAGDERAFEELIERHQSLVIGTIAKMLGDAGTAEDLAQQVFIRVWQECAALCRLGKIHHLVAHHHSQSGLQRNSPTQSRAPCFDGK
jgi:hypothetical protein